MRPSWIIVFFVAATLVIYGDSSSAQSSAQPSGLLSDLFSDKSKPAPATSKSKTQPSSTSKKKTSAPTPSGSSRNTGSATPGLFSGLAKTPEERAREEAVRKKAAAAKAREETLKAALEKKEAAQKAAELAAKKKQQDKEKALADAANKKADQEKAQLQAQREKEKERQRVLQESRRQKEAEEKALVLAEKQRADDLRRKQLEQLRLAELKARQIAEQKRMAEAEVRRLEEAKLLEQRRLDMELVARAQGLQVSRGLFRSRAPELPAALEVHPNTQVAQSPPNRYIYINQREISSLTPSNSRIEIDLRDQRARVFRDDTLIIETQISSGKSGHSTPIGNYAIQEMTIDKKSDRYGTWYNSSGAKLNGEDRFNPPSGAVRFEGADMPYWLRITGGIGMHIGFVPDGPASHGCIRVPSSVQPLIFSKVRIGTPVRIKG